MDIDTPEFMEYFLDLSVALTGFPKFNLQGTGQVSLYFSTIRDIVGGDMFRELLDTYHRLHVMTVDNAAPLAKRLRSDILGSEKFGPIARNIIKLWYVATWYQLPSSWRTTFGANEKDQTFIVSPQAYPEGLLWPTIGVNPPAAKAPGYGTWSEPPTAKLAGDAPDNEFYPLPNLVDSVRQKLTAVKK